jgi:hypothetical protein
MDGREGRGGPESHRAAVERTGSDVTVLEEPCTSGTEKSDRVREGQRGGRSRAVYSRHFVQSIGPGGTDYDAGEQVGNRA